MVYVGAIKGVYVDELGRVLTEKGEVRYVLICEECGRLRNVRYPKKGKWVCVYCWKKAKEAGT